MELNNPYKMIWLIIIGQENDLKVIEAYNQRSRYFASRNMCDTMEYRIFKQNYSDFVDLLKARSDKNVKKNFN